MCAKKIKCRVKYTDTFKIFFIFVNLITSVFKSCAKDFSLQIHLSSCSHVFDAIL